MTIKNKMIIITLAAMLIISGGCSSQESDASSSPVVSKEQSTEESVQSDVSGSTEELPSANSSDKTVSDARSEELKEIKILSDYRKQLLNQKTKTVLYKEIVPIENGYDSEMSFVENEEKEAKLEYTDSVIRDVNDDSHYEMLVQYRATSTNVLTGSSIYDSHQVFLYDIVSIVGGKAVESGHYQYEEGFINTGAAR